MRKLILLFALIISLFSNAQETVSSTLEVEVLYESLTIEVTPFTHNGIEYKHIKGSLNTDEDCFDYPVIIGIPNILSLSGDDIIEFNTGRRYRIADSDLIRDDFTSFRNSDEIRFADGSPYNGPDLLACESGPEEEGCLDVGHGYYNGILQISPTSTGSATFGLYDADGDIVLPSSYSDGGRQGQPGETLDTHYAELVGSTGLFRFIYPTLRSNSVPFVIFDDLSNGEYTLRGGTCNVYITVDNPTTATVTPSVSTNPVGEWYLSYDNQWRHSDYPGLFYILEDNRGIGVDWIFRVYVEGNSQHIFYGTVNGTESGAHASARSRTAFEHRLRN